MIAVVPHPLATNVGAPDLRILQAASALPLGLLGHKVHKQIEAGDTHSRKDPLRKPFHLFPVDLVSVLDRTRHEGRHKCKPLLDGACVNETNDEVPNLERQAPMDRALQPLSNPLHEGDRVADLHAESGCDQRLVGLGVVRLETLSDPITSLGASVATRARKRPGGHRGYTYMPSSLATRGGGLSNAPSSRSGPSHSTPARA